MAQGELSWGMKEIPEGQGLACMSLELCVVSYWHPTHKYSVSQEDFFFFVRVSLCLIWFQKASKNKKHTYIECGPMCVLFLHFWTIVL